MQATKCCTNFSSHMAKSERGLRGVPAPASSAMCRVGGIKRVPPTHLFQSMGGCRSAHLSTTQAYGGLKPMNY